MLTPNHTQFIKQEQTTQIQTISLKLKVERYSQREMGSSENKRDGVKIVQIETRYVETDALNFRDVVQSLTGKNSSTAWIGRGGSGEEALANSVKSDEFQFHHHGVVARDHDRRYYNKEDASPSSLSSMILKNTTTTSFKDFDRLLYELPPADDLPWLVGR